MSTPNNKRPGSSTTSNSSAKKFRQTTLSFAPVPRTPRPNDATNTISPRPAKPELKKPPPLNCDDSITSQADSICSFTSQDTDSRASNFLELGEDDDSQFSQALGSQLSELEFDSQESGSVTAEREGQQFVYPVPLWSRAIRKLDMAQEKRKPYGAQHKFHEARVAAETLLAIPQIIATTAATTEGKFYVDVPETRYFLNLRFSPNLPKCKISVTSEDSYAAAIRLLSNSPSSVCVLNMASSKSQGGGWLEGCTAQEEQLCYRSTLIRTLDPSHYPWPDLTAIFSPSVAIFRASAPNYEFYASLTPPRDPEMVSVISVAAIRCKKLKDRWEMPWQRRVMRQKMKLILRICARNKQKRLVLSAFGCGAFLNPNIEVAELWKEILEEKEFRGWWEEIVFAVFVPKGCDPESDSNFVVFRDVLEGVEV